MRNIQKKKKKEALFSIEPLAVAALFAAGYSPYTMTALLAALLHESGHLLAIWLCRRRIRCIRVTGLGAEIKLYPSLCPYSEEIFISLSGLAANLTGTLVSAAFPGSRFCVVFAFCNLSLLALNALPVSGLDGGEALRYALLASRFAASAVSICRTVSFFGILPLWLSSLYLLFYRAEDLSLFSISAYLFLSAVWHGGTERNL